MNVVIYSTTKNFFGINLAICGRLISPAKATMPTPNRREMVDFVHSSSVRNIGGMSNNESGPVHTSGKHCSPTYSTFSKSIAFYLLFAF